MKQADILEARRRVLLERCEQQRVDISYRLEQITPAHQLSAWTTRAQHLGRSPLGPPLLFWGATLLATLMFLRPRRAAGKVQWLATAVAMLGRATQIMRMLSQLRQLTALFRAGQRPG